ncbi:MAG: DUF3150 domain-containing protein [Bacillota bacterium]
MQFERIFADGVLIDVDIRYWSGQRKLTAQDLQLKEVPDIYSLGRKYLVFKEVINNFRRIEKRARRLVDSYSFIFPVGNTRFMPRRAALEALPRLDEIRAEFMDAAEAFIATYDELREKMLQKYAQYRQYLEPYYPDSAWVRSRFSFDYHLYTITAPDVSGMEQVSGEELQAKQMAFEEHLRNYRERLSREFDHFIAGVVKQLRFEAAELCNKIAEKVKQGEVVTERSLNRLRQLVDKYTQLNFVGDRQIEEMLCNLRDRWLSGEIPDAKLDQFAGALREVVTAASQVTDISAITGTYKRRIKIA